MNGAPPGPTYDSPSSRHSFYTRVLSDVRALPGVTGAGYVSFLPMVMGGGIWGVTPAGQPVQGETRDASRTARVRFATPGYFATMDIPILKGSDLSDEDRVDRPFAAVVSESFVRRQWPDEEPIGKRFTIAFHDREVVGVVGEVRVRGLERTSEPQVYLPPQQQPEGLSNCWPKDLVIRSETAPGTLAPAVRAIVRAADPEQAVSDVRTMAEILTEETASRAVQLRVLGALAAIAFLLAGIGIHGLLSFTVTQRAQEIGVRMTLGAKARNVVAMVVGQGMVLALSGILPGVLGAYLAGRAIQAVLFGVPPADTVTFGSRSAF
ncbi:MAG: ABC transporter permease [Gemmatimonadota bacterium]